MVALVGTLLAWAPAARAAGPEHADVPLVVGGRTIHVFRAPLGDLSTAERAEAARRHITRSLGAGGAGWTSISPVENGMLVKLDDVPMFTVIAGDAVGQGSETVESLANAASRVLQKVWTEDRLRRDPSVNVAGILAAIAACAVLVGALAALRWMSRRLQHHLARLLARHLERLAKAGVASNLSGAFLRLGARSGAILLWLLGLLAVFLCISFVLGQFATTRPLSDSLIHSLETSLASGLHSAVQAVPGLFVALLIFMAARITTQISRALFDGIAAGRLRLGSLDAHTATAARQLINTGIWLFALAMSYPYLPGSHTEAFKGLSVLLGIMVSIGASGLVGQVASGLILVFTRTLLVGEYVRIREYEGTVTGLGMCVTRLRTGTGEEITLPNSLVIGHVTRNLSRLVTRGGFLLDTEVTIGYDTPWRQVHAMLLEAARQVPAVRQEPPPFVVQTALSDFSVAYRLVAHGDAGANGARPQVLSELNAAIQDAFNRYGVQIMSPHYLSDPPQAKLVPEGEWHRAPAAPPPGGAARLEELPTRERLA